MILYTVTVKHRKNEMSTKFCIHTVFALFIGTA